MTKDQRIHRGSAELLNAGAWLAIPNEYVDELLPAMKASEFAVLLVIKRWTHGFGQASRTMSQGMIQDKTGLSRSGVRKALKALQEGGHIKKVRETDHLRACEWALNEDYGKDAERATENPSVGYSVTHSGLLSNPPTVKDTLERQEGERQTAGDASLSSQENGNGFRAGLARLGIEDPALSELALRADITPSMIDAWARYLREHPEYGPGLAITFLRREGNAIWPPAGKGGNGSRQKQRAEVVPLGTDTEYRHGPLAQRRNDAFQNRLDRQKAKAAEAA